MISPVYPTRSKWRSGLVSLSGALAIYLTLTEGPVFGQANSQQIPGNKPSFEVASIKPSKPGDYISSLSTSNGRLEARNLSVRQLIELGYNTEVSSAPDWIDSAHYDVQAKMSDDQYRNIQLLDKNVQADQIRLMVQSLLADRFQLSADLKPEMTMGYALVIAKGGSKLHVSHPSDTSPPEGRHDGTSWVDIDLRDVPLSRLAAELGGYFEDKVVDDTHLSGYFDIRLRVDSLIDGSRDAAVASLNSALQAQLGSKAQYRRIMFNTVVVRHIQRPSPD